MELKFDLLLIIDYQNKRLFPVIDEETNGSDCMWQYCQEQTFDLLIKCKVLKCMLQYMKCMF